MRNRLKIFLVLAAFAFLFWEGWGYLFPKNNLGSYSEIESSAKKSDREIRNLISENERKIEDRNEDRAEHFVTTKKHRQKHRIAKHFSADETKVEDIKPTRQREVAAEKPIEINIAPVLNGFVAGESENHRTLRGTANFSDSRPSTIADETAEVQSLEKVVEATSKSPVDQVEHNQDRVEQMPEDTSDIRSPAQDEKPVQSAPDVKVEKPAEVKKFEKPAPVDENDMSSKYYLGTGFEYFVIDSKDITNNAAAKYISEASPLIKFDWELDWDDNDYTHLGVSQVYEKLTNPNTTTKRLTDKDGSRTTFDASYEKKWGSKFSTRFGLVSTQRIFVKALNASNILIDRVQEIDFKLEQGIAFVKREHAEFGASVSISAIRNSDGQGYSTNNGWAGEAKIYIDRDLKKYPLKVHGNIYYGTWNQDSTYVSQKERHLGFELGAIGTW